MDRDFKGIWIPKEIWLDENLDPVEMKIIAEVHSLSQQQKGCIALNDHFAKLVKREKKTVSNIISRLKRKGYLDVKVERNDKKEVVKREMKIGHTLPPSKWIPSPRQNGYPPPVKMDTSPRENGIESTNRKYQLKYNIVEREKIFRESTLRDYIAEYSPDMINDFLDYWTEAGENDTKMRFEKERTWNLKRRLARWSKNEKKFKNKKVAPKNKSIDRDQILKEYYERRK